MLGEGSMITAGILSFCFIENEIRRLYKYLVSDDNIPGRVDDIVYLQDIAPLTFKNIYDKAVGLFSSHVDHWKLLELVESSHPSARRKGLQLLTANHTWKDHEYHQIAQSLSDRTIASLARVKDVDQRFFRPMPKLESELQSQFQDDKPGEAESNEASPTYDQHKARLIALTSDTMGVDKCVQFVGEGGLGILQQILKKYSSDIVLHRLIAFVLANLSMVGELHPQIIEGGWALVLHQWMDSDDVELYFHSNRALANLDRDSETDIRVPALYEDGVFLGYPVHRSSNPDDEIVADIVFIHGLQGGPFKTWRQKDKPEQEPDSGQEKRTVFWPKDWLVPDLQDTVRVLNIGYDAASSFWTSETVQNKTGPAMIQTGYSLLHKLKQADIGSRPVIWVGHSMGGLVIKEILFLAETDPNFKQFVKNTRGVIFYSTPHKGSTIASVFKLMLPLRPTQAVKDLEYGNKYLTMLHKSFIFTVLKYNIPCLSFGEGEKTDFGLQISLNIVESESADPNVGEFHEVPCNHISTCKPESKDSLLYRHTLSFLHRCLQNLQNNASMQEEDVVHTVSGLLRQYRGKS